MLWCVPLKTRTIFIVCSKICSIGIKYSAGDHEFVWYNDRFDDDDDGSNSIISDINLSYTMAGLESWSNQTGIFLRERTRKRTGQTKLGQEGLSPVRCGMTGAMLIRGNIHTDKLPLLD